MKEHQKSDRIIKNKLDEYQMDAPMHLFEGVMDALDSETAPEKKSRRGGFWLLALLVVGLTGGGLWYATSSDNTIASGENELSILSSKKTTTVNFNQKENIEKTDSRNSFSQKTNTTESVDLPNSAKTNTQNSSTPLASTNAISTEKTLSNDDLVKNKINDSSILNVKNTSVKIQENTSTNTFENTIVENKLTPKGSINNTVLAPRPSLKTPVANIENNAFENTGDVVGKNNAPIAVQKATTIFKKGKVVEVFYLPKLDHVEQVVNRKFDQKVNVETACGIKPDGSKIKFTTSVDLFLSPDYASHMIEYKDTEFEEYARMRTESEGAALSFNTGVRVNFLTEFGWAIRTGLVYTQINETFKTQHRETVITIDVATGDTLGYTEGIRDVRIKNRYKMIDIPLIVGYEVPMKKFNLNINGGVYLNLMSKQSGAFFSPLEDKVVYFTEGHPDNYDIFKDNIGLSVFLGLGFNVPLSKKMQLIIEPHTRYYPKSFTIRNYILNQKYISGGVMIGLRRDL